ncbi:MAG: hypothetical protein F4X58_02290 [Chloroflexi bacterium]|nr:hypothetical protein [Chloroflexota bacterium]MYC00734.1 hypothetical protein [Chloroflexota bacterium]
MATVSPVAKEGATVLKPILTLTAIALIAFAFVTTDRTEAQTEQVGAALEVRVIAIPHENGAVEFGVEYNGERILPQGRFLSVALAEARVGEWLSSTPVEIVGPAKLPAVLGGANEYRDVDNLWELPGFGPAVEVVRVHAKPYADGRVEFALGHFGQLLQPQARFLTPTLRKERIGQWLRSTPVEVVAQQTAPELVRSISAEFHELLRHSTLPADVARDCVLETVSTPPSEVHRALRIDASWAHGGLERALTSTGSPFIERIRDKNTYYETIATMYATTSAWTGYDYSGIPADKYVFYVEVPRHTSAPPPEQWLAAEFACVETDDSWQSVTPVDDTGGSLE